MRPWCRITTSPDFRVSNVNPVGAGIRQQCAPATCPSSARLARQARRRSVEQAEHVSFRIGEDDLVASSLCAQVETGGPGRTPGPTGSLTYSSAPPLQRPSLPGAPLWQPVILPRVRRGLNLGLVLSLCRIEVIESTRGTGRVGVIQRPPSHLCCQECPGGPLPRQRGLHPMRSPTPAAAHNTTANSRFTTIPSRSRMRRLDADVDSIPARVRSSTTARGLRRHAARGRCAGSWARPERALRTFPVRIGEDVEALVATLTDVGATRTEAHEPVELSDGSVVRRSMWQRSLLALGAAPA